MYYNVFTEQKMRRMGVEIFGGYEENTFYAKDPGGLWRRSDLLSALGECFSLRQNRIPSLCGRCR